MNDYVEPVYHLTEKGKEAIKEVKQLVEQVVMNKYLLTIAEIAPIQKEWEDKAVDYFSRPEEEQTGPLPEHWDDVLCNAQHLKTLRIQAEECREIASRILAEAKAEIEEEKLVEIERREKVALMLYFDFEEFDNGTLAMDTWVNGSKHRKAMFYAKADQIINLLKVRQANE